MQISSLWNIKEEFRLKIGLLGLTFFFLTATQSLWRSLKASVFAKIVGASYVPSAKIYGIFVLIPLILIYSKLVDVLRRHQLVYVFTILHGIGGLILAYYLAHPTIGLGNLNPSADRWIGWFFYFFMESFCAFMSTTFWSFANSINKPKDARQYYGPLVAISKMGGILGAASMWLIFEVGIYYSGDIAQIFHLTSANGIQDRYLIGGTLLAGSICMFAAAFCIKLLMDWVPGYYMHGYEAAYQVEKKRERQVKKEKFSLLTSAARALEGLRVIITLPYVLGIFSLSLFHDMVMTIFDYHVLMSADASYNTPGKLALFYAGYFLTMHVIGLFISVLGTTPLQRALGNRAALLLYPFMCMGMVVVSFFFPTTQVFFAAVVLIRAANYGLNHPIREVLYIPTTKEIKFKCKAWSDAFGTRIAKGSASVFYQHALHYSPAIGQLMSSAFTFSITFMWVIISYFLGRTLQRALDHKQVIGEKETSLAANK